ncbi:MAG: helix-turn-helix transcriptional regulator [Clostridia bacterium]|nr:helix-turn-helix transcriptional regulator [Clostridia bacterium]
MSHTPKGPRFIGGPPLSYEIDYRTYDTFDDFSLHFHDCYEIFIHVSGGHQLYFNQEVYNFQPLGVYVFPPYHIHGLIGPEPLQGYERLCIRLAASALDRLGGSIMPLHSMVDKFAQDRRKLRLTPEHWKTIREQINHISPDTPSQPTAEKLISTGALSVIMGTISQANRQAVEPQVNNHADDPLPQKICHYLATHFTEEFSLDALSARFNVSKHHLSHRFADALGVSVYQYVLMCRVAYAKKLIQEGEPFSAAAYRCGFNDYSNFLRIFSRHTGMTPSKWKELSSAGSNVSS